MTIAPRRNNRLSSNHQINKLTYVPSIWKLNYTNYRMVRIFYIFLKYHISQFQSFWYNLYIFPKTRGNKNKQCTHSTPLKEISCESTFLKVYTFIYLTLKYDKKKNHKKLQNCEDGTILDQRLTLFDAFLFCILVGPGPVRGLRVSSLLSTSLQVSWEKPVDTGCPSQTSYIVRFWKKSSKLPCGNIEHVVSRNVTSTTKTMITLNDLYPDSLYFVNVYMNGGPISIGRQVEEKTLMKGKTNHYI